MTNPKCVFEFKEKAKFTPSDVKHCLSPEHVKSNEDKIEIRNGIDGILIQPRANNNVNHIGRHLQVFPLIDVGSDGIPSSKLSMIEIQPEEATIEQVLQTRDGINDVESAAIEVKMANVPTKNNVTDSNCAEIEKVPTDYDVMNGVISNEIKNNEIPKPDVQMDNVVVKNLLSNDLANPEDTLDDVENTSVHSNAVLLSVVEDLPSNNNKADENPTSVDDNANDIEIIENCTANVINEQSANETNETFKNDLEKNLESGDGKLDNTIKHRDTRLIDIEIIENCTANVINEQSANETNETFKNDLEKNLESGDGKLDNNIKHRDTRLIESNESGNLSNEIVTKSTDLLQTVQNTHSRSLTLLIQPTDIKNTGVLNSGYRDDERENYVTAAGAPFGDTGIRDTDDSFSGGQVSGPVADDQSIDCSTYYAHGAGAPFGDYGAEDTDDSFSGDQVSGPLADGQSIDCSTSYTGFERVANSDNVSDENLFNKENQREKKRVSVMNENMQTNGNHSGTDNSGFISDDDIIDTVVDISKLPRRSIRFSVYSTFKIPSEPKWHRKLGACVVVFCAFWNCFFAMGIAFSMGTFLPEWLDEFNDGRAKTAMIQSVLVGVMFGAGLLIGISIDRYGVRLTIFVGSLMSCCGFLGAIFCPSTTALLLSVAILPGLGLSGAQLGSIVAVSMACKRSVSVAIGLITAGGGCGSSIFPYFFKFLIDKYGWRGAFFVIAGFSLQPMVFGFLMTAFMDQVTASRGHRVENAVVTVKEKMKLMCRPEFITVALCAPIAFSAANGFLFIIVDYANTKNQNGVFLLFLLTIISTFGRLAFGFLNLLSFVNSRILLTIAAILSGGSLICLGFVAQYARILGILVVLGFNYGGQIGIVGVAILDLVGQQAFSLALGLCATLNGTGSAIGGVIYGLLFDMSGSYSQPCIIMGTVCCVFGVLPILGLFYSKIKTNCKSAIGSD
ncbi:hypothetical protein SNE40_021844 [Patella caerulea]|uniref:Major facilitator superfamily (MFS) profile domain-containing protein n=1 Tax=Patella caerulea TaxID=87958 RepID=A0AAN8G8Q9_PATCE